MPHRDKLFLSSPHMSGNEMKYINEAFDLNWIAPLGNNVDGFERELAVYNQVEDVAVVSSGTSAIHLALDLLGVGAGDSVFVSSLTFVASANPVLYLGAEPVLIDSESETWNMSPEALERALKEAKEKQALPKAIVIVHLYGQSAKVDELLALAKEYDVPVIEDAAESLGSEYKGAKSGSHGDFGIYSFNGNKIITTSGGGALVSNDKEAIQKARFLSTQARDPALHYQHSEVGYNYRMSNIVAGIGRGQLEVLDDRVQAKRDVFNRYEAALKEYSGISFQPELKNTKSNRWLTALTINPEQIGVNRTEIIDALAEENIEARPVWKPMHLQPLFEAYAYYPHEEDFSVSDQLFETGLCLPSGSNMTKEQQEKVIKIIQDKLK